MRNGTKPEIEELKKFHLLDLISTRHLEYLRDKTVVLGYKKGMRLFDKNRSPIVSYYLLRGSVQIQQSGKKVRVDAGTSASYCALEKKLSDDAAAIAFTDCEVIQIGRALVEQYFSWNTTGQYRIVDIASFEEDEKASELNWVNNLLESTLAKNLSTSEAQHLLSLFEDRRVRERETLLRSGVEGNAFYILKNGHAQITYENGAQESLGPGEFFGEECLISDSVSQIDVVMTTPGLVAELYPKYFNEVIKRSFIKRIEERHVRVMDRRSYAILDVRIHAEYKAGHYPGCHHMSITSLKRKISSLKKNLMYFISPDSGARGDLAAYLLQQAGYRAFVIQLEGKSSQQITKQYKPVSSVRSSRLGQ